MFHQRYNPTIYINEVQPNALEIWTNEILRLGPPINDLLNQYGLLIQNLPALDNPNLDNIRARALALLAQFRDIQNRLINLQPGFNQFNNRIPMAGFLLEGRLELVQRAITDLERIILWMDERL